MTAVAKNRKAVLSSLYEIDVCDTNKVEVIVDLKIGEIYGTDEFYGFGFEITYNPDKIRFTTPLYVGTMSELFDLKEVTFPEKGVIRGYAGTFSMNPRAGNRPLIAIKGKYIGKCFDTTEIKLSYIDFTDEFKDSVTEFENTVVKSIDTSTVNRYVEVTGKNDSLAVKKDSKDTIVSIGLTHNLSKKIGNMDFNVSFDNFPKIYCDSFIVNENLKIDSIIVTNNGYLLIASVIGEIKDKDIFEMKINYENMDIDSSTIKVEPIVNDSCLCIKSYISKNIYLYKVKNDTTSVEDRKENNYYFLADNNNYITYRTENEGLFDINYYNIYGQLIKTHSQLSNKLLQIETVNLINGYYIVVLKNKQEQKIIRIIKN